MAETTPEKLAELAVDGCTHVLHGVCEACIAGAIRLAEKPLRAALVEQHAQHEAEAKALAAQAEEALKERDAARADLAATRDGAVVTTAQRLLAAARLGDSPEAAGSGGYQVVAEARQAIFDLHARVARLTAERDAYKAQLDQADAKLMQELQQAGVAVAAQVASTRELVLDRDAWRARAEEAERLARLAGDRAARAEQELEGAKALAQVDRIQVKTDGKRLLGELKKMSNFQLKIEAEDREKRLGLEGRIRVLEADLAEARARFDLLRATTLKLSVIWNELDDLAEDEAAFEALLDRFSEAIEQLPPWGMEPAANDTPPAAVARDGNGSEVPE